MNVEIILLVCILFIILYGHLFISCSQKSPYGLLEGMTTNKNKNKNKKEGFHNQRQNQNQFDPLIFSRTAFKPECCPSSYSNSQGCACISTKQYEYLITRGGNNVPYSQY